MRDWPTVDRKQPLTLVSRRLLRGPEFFCEFGDKNSETQIRRDAHHHYRRTSRRRRALQGPYQRHYFAKGQKNYDYPIDTRVVFSRGSWQHRVDCSVHVGAAICVKSHTSADDAYASFHNSVERMEKRLRRYKKRLNNHHRGAPAKNIEVRCYVLSPEDKDQEQIEDIQTETVTGLTANALTVSVRQARLQLDCY